MEIKVDRDSMLKSVARVQNIVEKRSNMPILSMILLSTNGSSIQISATDLEISLRQEIPANIIKPGSITISGRKLFEILKESKSPEIYLKEREKNWVFISDEKTKYNLACLSAEEFPVFIEPEGVVTVELDGGVLREMINKTIYSVTLEEAGFKLSGVYTEKVDKEGKIYLRMVSTDGHRLSMIDKEIENIMELNMENGVMIPKKGMMELSRIITDGEKIQIGFKHNNCIAKKDNLLFIIRLLETKFPDYHAVIPKLVKHKIKIKREDLLEVMKRMIILSNESYKGVKITLDKNNMELVSINPDLGDVQDNLEIDYNGETLEMGFNSRYFIDALQSMDSEHVELGFIDNSSPCTIRGEKDVGFLGLIMPMRI